MECGKSVAENELPEGQLTLDDLLAEIPAQLGATPPRPSLDRRRLHRILTALLEVHAGRRPATQLGSWLAPALQRRLRDRARTTGPRYTLHKVYLCRPTDKALEVCGTADTGERVLAVAARFEHDDSSWRCTSFTILEPGGWGAKPMLTG
ncbi:Rv3235 family protein [Saccharomonospora sp. NPDC046836]|uniref:Rv3235 family protein n=1 Tax=Saccharomonospora sp. NPDC046836 TaxID=3156921 RepID=UPI00340FCAAE